MEFEVSYSLENEQQFWEELDDIVATRCDSHALIDNALRSYLHFTSNYRAEYLQSEYDIARCSYKLAQSDIFASQKDYVRRQIIYGLLQEDAADTLHLVSSFLLFDGRQDERTFEMMNEEGALARLLELIQSQRDDDGSLHRRLLELLYEMSRIQRLKIEDLKLIDDGFITYLFQIIEQLSDDVNDPYHYPVIRLVLNEQYMVSAHQSSPNSSPTDPPTNRVIKLLSLHGAVYKTFGENIILLLNRESETSLQLLILKLLYLLFTNRPTYEYFYTNDLRVLVDVMLRNLLDLPDDEPALRHTYLRVLYPLLAHTQLRTPPHYKRADILRLLDLLTSHRSAHFAPVDDTTTRLVARCHKVPWLAPESSSSPSASSPTAAAKAPPREMTLTPPPPSSSSVSTTTTTTVAASERHLLPPPLAPSQPNSPARRALGISSGPASAATSSLSVNEVASTMERPGVMTKSRRNKGPPPPLPPLSMEAKRMERKASAGNGVKVGREVGR